MPSTAMTRTAVPLGRNAPSDTTSTGLPSISAVPAGRSSVRTMPRLPTSDSRGGALTNPRRDVEASLRTSRRQRRLDGSRFTMSANTAAASRAAPSNTPIADTSPPSASTRL